MNAFLPCIFFIPVFITIICPYECYKYITLDVELFKIDVNKFHGDIFIGGGGSGKIFYIKYDYIKTVLDQSKQYLNLTQKYQDFDYSSQQNLNNQKIDASSLLKFKQNNEEKINFLIISYNNGGYLLACGIKYYRGLGLKCSIHSLSDLNDHIFLDSKPENIFSSNKSSYAFFAPGPSILSPVKNSQVLYVGYTYDPDRPNNFSPLSLSSRREAFKYSQYTSQTFNTLKKSQFDFAYTYDDGVSFTGINVAPHYQRNILIKYLYGFDYQGFSYFLTLQNNSINNSPDKTFQTRIVRVCQEDLSFFSYTEVPITCFSSPDQFEYNIAQTAFFGPYQADYTTKVGAGGGMALYVSMTSSYPNFHLDVPNESLGSTLCIYPIADIISSFREAVQRCYDGIGDHIPYIVGVKEKCVRANKTITDSYCGSSLNFPIETDVDLFAHSVHRFESIITSLAVHNYTANGKSNVLAFLGTRDGFAHKVLLESQRKVSLYSSDVFAQGWKDVFKGTTSQDIPAFDRSIKSSNAFSPDHNYLYFLALNKLFIMPMNSCSLYETCGDCLKSGPQDPLACGWCSHTDSCTAKSECPLNAWTQSHCFPLITKISPSSGPMEGGTTVIIEGDYFGEQHSSTYNILLGGRKCDLVNATMRRILMKTPRGHNYDGLSSTLSVEVIDRTRKNFGFMISGLAKAPTSFTYRNVRIDSYEPDFGIYSGKNEIIVKGQYLDAGSRASVQIGSSLQCDIIYRNRENLSCVTQPYKPSILNDLSTPASTQDDQPSNWMLLKISIHIDGYTSILKPDFVLKPNPSVQSIEPKQSIMSGGSILTLRCRGMDKSLASRAYITFHPLLTTQDLMPQKKSSKNVIALQISIADCTPSTLTQGGLYFCRAPNFTKITIQNGRLPPTAPLITARVLVNLFGVMAYSDAYSFYPDPVYYPFPKDTIYLNPDTQMLEIKGSKIDLVHTKKDVKIMIGSSICEIVKMASTYVTCIPPRFPNQPNLNFANQTTLITDLSTNRVRPKYSSLNLHGSAALGKSVVKRKAPSPGPKTREGLDKYGVVVFAGPIEFHLGHVVYSTEPIKSNFVWAILAAILLLVFFALFLVLAIWTKRRRARRLKKPHLPQSLPGMRYSELGLRYDTDFANRYPSIRTIQNYYQPTGMPAPSTIALNQGETDALRSGASTSSGLQESVPCFSMENLDPETALLLADPSSIMIPREELIIGHMLGQGNFGRVYRGYWKRGALTVGAENDQRGNDKIEIDVAVKTLNTCFTDNESLKAFLQEGLRMKEFNHPHVLSLIGITWVPGQSPLVILPFMPNGDLLSHLRNPKTQPTIGNLLNWAVDISQAMDYLSNLKFVHRDLAARNCMLDADYRAVVSDFGLSRDIYEKDYYSSSNKNIKLPVKWMALESLQKNVYNSKTDVWSFGIVLWELMTRGVNPYPDVDNWDIINYLRAGRRLQQPLYCPDSLYTIMTSCWLPDPTQRPDFSSLTALVTSVIDELATEQKETIYDYNAPPFEAPEPYLSVVNNIPASAKCLKNEKKTEDSLNYTDPNTSGATDETVISTSGEAKDDDGLYLN